MWWLTYLFSANFTSPGLVEGIGESCRSLTLIVLFILGYQLEHEEINEDVIDPLGLQHGPFILGMVCSVATFTINQKVKPNQAHKHEAI